MAKVSKRRGHNAGWGSYRGCVGLRVGAIHRRPRGSVMCGPARRINRD